VGSKSGLGISITVKKRKNLDKKAGQLVFRLAVGEKVGRRQSKGSRPTERCSTGGNRKKKECKKKGGEDQYLFSTAELMTLRRG